MGRAVALSPEEAEPTRGGQQLGGGLAEPNTRTVELLAVMLQPGILMGVRSPPDSPVAA